MELENSWIIRSSMNNSFKKEPLVIKKWGYAVEVNDVHPSYTNKKNSNHKINGKNRKKKPTKFAFRGVHTKWSRRNMYIYTGYLGTCITKLHKMIGRWNLVRSRAGSVPRILKQVDCEVCAFFVPHRRLPCFY